MSQPVRVAPSLLAADFAALGDAVRLVASAPCDLLHLDVMDGSFVPNISYGPVVVEAVRRVCDLYLDVHLMIEEPLRYVDAFAKAGSDGLTVHVDACSDVAETLAAIRAAGMRPGLTLRPGTPVEDLEPHLPAIDLLLVMTVEPGFGGQSYMADQEAKLAWARQQRQAGGFEYFVEVDGGIGRETAAAAVAAGAEILVAGSAIFGAADPVAEIKALQALPVASP